ncbi:RDD family protein [Nitrosomonas communis]|uniref:RDD family protein n=1 Tax=Nitrosomonas communis TaxID=44574 RepID=UPI0026E97951|nr:RDD family protein [Nitrosomonas communis]MCO6426464.1 RDD family protein [Nitrosomonas communis]
MMNLTPRFWRRAISMLYESLLLLAVWFIASFIFHFVFRDTTAVYFKPLFQFYLLFIAGIYFIWFWTHGGQTLAMQTWKMRVVSADGSKLTTRQAITRYLFAVIGITFIGFGIIWAFFDRDRQFLHDRLAGTRIIKVEN